MKETNQILINIGNNIRKERNKINMSQQVLADNCNLAKSTIQRIENGTLNPTILILVRICECLNLNIESIIRS